MELNKTFIRAVDFVVLSISLIAIISLVRYAQPLVIAPLDEYQTSNTSVLFAFEKGEAILIDDNVEFSSPDRILTNSTNSITLQPGTYYWKVEGVLNSDVRKLSVLSRVELLLRSTSEGYDVINAGTTTLDVAVYNQSTFVKNVTLAPAATETAQGDTFVGREHA